MEGKVEILGLRELNRAFNQIDSGLKKELKTAFKEIAEHVAADIRPKVPKRTGKAAASIKARGAQRGAAIAFGGSAAEYYPWLDFGGSVGKNKSVKREFIKEGRYVYPTIAEDREKILTETDQAIAKVVKSAGFETKGKG